MAKNENKKNEKKNNDTPKNLPTLKVTRKDALAVLTGMGFTKVIGYDNASIASRLKNLPTYKTNFDASGNTLDGNTQEKLDKMLEGLTPDTVITVTGEEPKGAKNVLANTKDTRSEIKGKEGKKTPSKAKKGKKRIDAICDQIKALPKDGLPLGKVAEAANKDYMAAGGEDNLKQTLHHIQVILPVLFNLGLARMTEDDKLAPAA